MLFFHILFSLASSPILLSLSYGMNPQSACQTYGFRNMAADVKNICELYSILEGSSAQAAYLQSWNGDRRGWVLEKPGRIVPYHMYGKPVYYVFCNQGYGPYRTLDGTDVVNEDVGTGVQEDVPY